jgi:hypothetical protein
MKIHFLSETGLQKIYFLHKRKYNDKNLSPHQCCRVEVILWGFTSGIPATADKFSSRNAQRQIHATVSFVNAAREFADHTNTSKAAI